MAKTIVITNGVTSSNSAIANEDKALVYTGGSAYHFTIGTLGEMTIFTGGTAIETEIYPGGKVFVSSGGILSATVLRDGAVLNGFTILSQGDMGSGVSVNGATVTTGSEAYLFDSQTANSIKLESGTLLFLNSGAGISNVQTDPGAEIKIYEGVTASNVALQSGVTVNGFLLQDSNDDIFSLSNGTVSDNANIYGGQSVISAVVSSGAKVNVNSGAVLSSATLRGVADISAGGRLDSAVNSGTLNVAGSALSIENRGNARIIQGGYLSGTTNFSGAGLIVSSSLASNVIVSGGSVSAIADGRMNQVRMSGGSMRVNHASVTDLGVSGALVNADSGAFIGNAVIGSNGRMIISSGTISGLTVENGGRLDGAAYLSALGAAAGTVFSNVVISSGGVVSTHFPDDNVQFYSNFRNNFSGTTLYSGGTLNGWTAVETNELPNSLNLSDVVVSSGNTANLYNEKVSNASISAGGLFNVSKGFSATAAKLTVSSGASVHINHGGVLVLNGKTVLDGTVGIDRKIVHYADKYKDVNAVIAGSASSSYYGVSNTVSSATYRVMTYTRSAIPESSGGGYTSWTSTGPVDYTVNPYSGGTAYVPTSWMSTDSLTSKQATVNSVTSIGEGSQGKIRLDFTGDTGLAANEAMINDISKISVHDTGVNINTLSSANHQSLDDPARYEFVYKPDDDETGYSMKDAYVLAGGAGSFGNQVGNLGIPSDTFRIVNTDGTSMIDKIAVGGSATSGNLTFYLRRDDTPVSYGDHLWMEIYNNDGGNATITTSTNQTATYTQDPVLVTAQFSQNTKVNAVNANSKQYRIKYADSTTWGTWTNYYVYQGVTMNKDGNVQFRGVGSSGNVKTETVTVTGIDITAPTFTFNATPVTNATVTVTATATDNDVAGYTTSGLDEIKGIQFQIDSLSEDGWQNYNPAEGVTVDQNAVINFRTWDKAGNVGNDSYTVSSIIDPKTPEIISISPKTLTNQDVTIAVSFDLKAIQNQVRIENGSWQNLGQAGYYEYTATQSGYYYFRSLYEGGLSSDEVRTAQEIQIDKDAPYAPTVTIDTEEITDRVVLTAEWHEPDEPSPKREYSYDQANWTAYTAPLEFTVNRTVYFRETDAAGNESEITSYKITNIGVAQAPVCTVDITEPTQQSVTISVDPVVGTTLPMIYQYKFIESDETETKWTEFDRTAGITVTKNKTVKVRAVQKESQEYSSFITTVTVDNILGPALDATWDTDWTHDPITVTATGSTIPNTAKTVSSAAWSLDDGANWNAITLTPDGYGNWSGTFDISQNGSFKVKMADEYGNETISDSWTITNYDAVPPSIDSITFSTETDPDNWTNVPVTVMVSASDDYSGVAKIEYSLDGGASWTEITYTTEKTAGTFTLTESGITNFEVRVTDNADNSTDQAGTVYIDTAPPEVDTFDYVRWTNQPDMTVTVDSHDPLSGVATVEYTLDGGTSWTDITEVGTFTLTEDGDFTVRFTDNAGNWADRNGSVGFDYVDPSIDSITFSPETDTDHWTTQDVTVTVSASDDYSGVAKIEYTLDSGTSWTEITYTTEKTEGTFTLTESGITDFTVRVTDNAGNFTEEGGSVFIDKVDPVIDSIEGNYLTVQVVNVTVSAHDDLSGMSKIEYSFKEKDAEEWGAWTEIDYTVPGQKTDGTFTIEVEDTKIYYYIVRFWDNAGNYVVTDQSEVQSDPDAPEITSLSCSPATDLSTWTNQDVTVSVSATDAISGVAKIEYTFNSSDWTEIDYTVPGQPTAGTFTLTAAGAYGVRVTDNAGNVAEQYGNVYIDKANPVINSLTVSTETDPTHWTTQDVTVTVSGSDALSGVAKIEYQFNGGAWTEITYTTEKTAGTFTLTEAGDFTARVTDKAGNYVEQSGTVYIDKTAPVIDSLSWNTDWTNQDVTVTVAASDAFSGVAKIEYQFNGGAWTEINYTSGKTDGTFTLTEAGVKNFTVRVTDNVGFTAEQSGTVKIDKVDPVMSLDWVQAWTPQNVTVTVSASDALSGVAKVEYMFNGGAWTDITAVGSFTVTEAGDFSVKVTDNAGNYLQQDGTVNIDKVNPVIDSLVWNPWTNSTTTVRVAASDSISGVAKVEYMFNGGDWAEITYTTPKTDGTFSVEGTGNFTVRVTDKAGNSVEQGGSIQLDTDAPVIDSITCSVVTDPDHWTNQDVTVTVAASDALSGVATIEYQFNSGAWTDITAAGTFTLTQAGDYLVRVTDNAGNTVEQGGTVYIDKGLNVYLAYSTETDQDHWTNQDVTVSVTTSMTPVGVKTIEYTLDSGTTWTDITAAAEFTVNEKVTFGVKVTDNLDNVAQDGGTVYIDKVDPAIGLITFSVDTDADHWTNQDVVVSVSASDTISGVAKIEYSLNGGTDWTEAEYTVPGQKTNGNFTLSEKVSFDVRVTDKAGNFVTAQGGTVYIDQVYPVIDSLTFSTDTDTDHWTNLDVTATISASDTLSGVKKIEYKFNDSAWTEITYTTEKTDGTFLMYGYGSYGVRVTDNAGNITEQTGTVYIDKVDPTIVSLDYNPWTNGSTTVTVSASDDLSGVAKIEYQFNGGEWTEITYTTDYTDGTFVVEGPGYFTVRVTDKAGNYVEQGGSIQLDTDAPEINTISCSPETDADHWTNQSVTVTVSASDDLSGVAKIEYTLDSGTTWSGITYTTDYTDGTFTLTESGEWAFTVRATDNAGNIAEQTGSVYIDKVDPTVSLAFDPATANTNWTTQDVTVTVTASDDLSGVAKVEYTFNGSDWADITADPSFTVTAFGAYGVRVTDKAGNEVLESGNIYIDKGAPEITSLTYSQNTDPDHWTDQNVTVTVAAFDELSGVGKIEYQFNSGDWTEIEYTSGTTAGIFTLTANGDFTVRATDNAGNYVEQSGSVYIDKADPEINSLDYNPWTNYDTTVTVSASDTLSGVAKIEYMFNGSDWAEIDYTTEYTDGTFTVIGAGDFTVRVTDNVGNYAEQSGNIQLDTVDPEIDSLTWNKEWTNQDVTVTVTAHDDLSGVAKIEYSFNGGAWTGIDYTTEYTDGTFTLTEAGNFTVRVTDNAGNYVEQPGTVKIDKVDPSIDSLTWNHDWTNQDVTVTVSASDALSGVEKIEYTLNGGTTWTEIDYTSGKTAGSFTLTESGITEFEVRVTDKAGNFAKQDGTVKIDESGPRIKSIDYLEAWTNADDVTVTVTADDMIQLTSGADLTLSGVKEAYYTFNGSAWTLIDGSVDDLGVYTGSFTLSESGPFMVKMVDNVGNETPSVSKLIKFDRQAPDMTVTPSVPGWTKDSMTIAVSASDPMEYVDVKGTPVPIGRSGVATYEYSFNGSAFEEFTGSFTLTEFGEYTVRVTDNAGNVAEEAEMVKIDKSGPRIKSIDYPEAWTNADEVTVTVTADDIFTFQGDDYQLSGVKEAYYTFNGSKWTLINGSVDDQGVYTGSFQLTESGPFMVKVVDNMGNETPSGSMQARFDRQAPELTLTPSAEGWTNGSMVITASASDPMEYVDVKGTPVPIGRSGVAKYEYTFNGSPWTEFTESFELTEFGPYAVRVTDGAGNSSVLAQNVKIDQAAPRINSIDYPENWTNAHDVTVTVTADDMIKLASGADYTLSGVKEAYYTFNGSKWTLIEGSVDKGVYTGSFKLTESGPFMVKVVDNAGNEKPSGSMQARFDRQAPDMTVTPSVPGWTKDSMTISVSASDPMEYVDVKGTPVPIGRSGVATYEYSFNGSDFEEFTGSFTLTEFGEYTVRVTDNAGNASETSELVKIDQAGPNIKDVDYDDTEWTNQNLAVTVTANDIYTFMEQVYQLSGVKEAYYSFEGSEWILIEGSVDEQGAYTGSFEVTDHGLFKVKVVDNVGNATESVDYEVIHIDKVDPTIDSVTWDTEWTNKDVTVTAEVSDDLSGVAKTEYKLAGGDWTEFTAAFTVTKNGKFQVRVTDNAGNVTVSDDYEVTNIDKVDPTVDITLDDSTVYEITIDAADDLSGVASTRYSLNDGAWKDYSKPFALTANGTLKVRVTDNAGNVTEDSRTYTDLDFDGPTISISSDPEEPTTGFVTVTVTAEDQSGVDKTTYSFDNKVWTVFKGQFILTDNCTFVVKAVDKRGNETISDPYVVDNIIKAQSVSSMLTGEELESWSDASSLLSAALPGAVPVTLGGESASGALIGNELQSWSSPAAEYSVADDVLKKFGNSTSVLSDLLAV